MPAEQTGSQAQKPRIKRTPKAPRQAAPLLDAELRSRTPAEVALGFDLPQAQAEALRCLNCKDPKCQDACPIHTDIRGFINSMVEGDYNAAYKVLQETNPFPGICGRVCQKELFCEKHCLLGVKLESVAIGSLERFLADYHRLSGEADPMPDIVPNGLKVALVGSGPASLICANDLARKGYSITVFEALHDLGGVLAYGIPPFRLPREIIREEVERLKNYGVEFRTNFIVGKTATLDELFEQGFAAVFLGTGAGLPWLMGIPGENLIGVYTANEFLTRINLMHAFEFPKADTPVHVGRRTVVIGGGNSAMDAARWAKRMGSDVTILYRRGRVELKARAEEIEHAEEEGIVFEFLAAPVRLFGDDKGVVKEMECIRMELGEPDESGRRSPKPLPGSEYRIPVDTVVAAIGQGPNPTLQRETPRLITKRDKIVIDANQQTSVESVFAGGDVVRGGSTVILAMQDGRAAAQSIDRALRERFPEAFQSVSAAEPRKSESTPRFRIVAKRRLSPEIVLLEVHAPEIQAHWKPGQFVILRPTPASERIPLTLVEGDRERGTITLIVQAIGKTTRELAALEEGDCLADLLGPLGKAGHIANVGAVMCIGGGVGVAELLPIARAFRQAGNHVIAMCGARTKDHIILDKELRDAADELHWSTDDGSFGFNGNVVQMMRAWRAEHSNSIGGAHVIGPIPMMRFASELTREWGVPTVASLNPIMVDGTGMCGGCRVSVGGDIRFACVDGPEFDAHKVDFDELTRRTRAYLDQERLSREGHQCRIGLDG
ncbi:MAG: NADPH-dependent glutamate synthase [Bryobacteraceae bacterium]|nr:NADPH-dependent glutamate synthase [Bryobacteraceae bacterium]